MLRAKMISVLMFFVAVAVLTGCGRLSGLQPSGIYYRQVPEELTASIDAGLRQMSQAKPLPPEVQDEVRTAVNGMAKDTSLSPQQWKTIKEIGDGALPIVADMLTSPDDSLRLRAVISLTAFERPSPAGQTPEYRAKTEPALLQVCRRSLLDRSYDVREEAFGLIFRLGVRRPRTQLAPILAAFREALNDPDERIRKEAQDAIDFCSGSRSDPSRGELIARNLLTA